MNPNVGEPGSRSTGPNVAMPSAASGQRRECSTKKASAPAMVSAGLVVGRRSSARTSSGPEPIAQTTLVPPTSIPPTINVPAIASPLAEMRYSPLVVALGADVRATRSEAPTARAPHPTAREGAAQQCSRHHPHEEDVMSSDLCYTP